MFLPFMGRLSVWQPWPLGIFFQPWDFTSFALGFLSEQEKWELLHWWLTGQWFRKGPGQDWRFSTRWEINMELLLFSLVTAVLGISGAPLFCSMLKSLEGIFYGILFNSCYLRTLTCSAVHLELKFLTEVKTLPSCATPKLAGLGDSEAWRAWQWRQALHSDSVSVWTPLVLVQTWAGWRENTRRFSPSLPLAECFNPLYCLWYPRPANISAQLSCILSFHCFSYNKASHTLYFSSLRLKSLPVKKNNMKYSYL